MNCLWVAQRGKEHRKRRQPAPALREVPCRYAATIPRLLSMHYADRCGGVRRKEFRTEILAINDKVSPLNKYN